MKYINTSDWTLCAFMLAAGLVQGCGSSSETGNQGATSSGGTSTAGGSGNVLSSAPNGSGSGGTSAAVTGNTSASAASGGAIQTTADTTAKFSFFITSQARLFGLAQAYNGSSKGFGGDLRYGETGDGAGLRGADKICTQIAEASMPGNGKSWRAFLSVTTDGTSQVNAISRIGSGPWYDRIGRLVANNTTELLNTRPVSANTTIINDLPNEDGVPNHDALQTGNTANQDNHDILTGSTASGTLYGASATCSDWTSAVGTASQKPRCGHSWPAGGAGAGGMGGPPGGAMGGGSMSNWMSALDEAGCAPGVNLAESVNGQPSTPGSDGTLSVGSGGGYGGIYCFALTP